jgi:8-oxo-dGTP pyrophosphatase MutT (NUDIX family)
MVKQYRHGIEEIGIELPGGAAEKGETVEEAMYVYFLTKVI